MPLIWAFVCALSLLAGTGVALAQTPAAHSSGTANKLAPSRIATVFHEGEEALHAGDLDRAESSFRRVLAADPASAGAYSNLGVVAMRRQHWQEAVRLFTKAAKLAPSVSGIRLNIGLAYYRQNRYDAAIAPLESVLRDQSSSGQALSGQASSNQAASGQARYLLGLCYFFTGRYADAAHTLEFLWPEQAGNLAYLYVLGVAAQHAKLADLEKRAISHMVEIGRDTAQFHLFMGKAHLNREETADAIGELSHAAELDPKLPFVHFNLGVAYLRQQDYEHAKTEFLKDVALEPDIPFSYDQLGLLFFQAGNDSDSEHNFQEALRCDSNFLSAHLGLARVRQRLGKYAEALLSVEAAEKLAPENAQVLSLKAQILEKLGHHTQAQATLQRYRELLERQRAQRERQMEGAPNPELLDLPSLQ
jgi:tetratricopeptide (TPR) repeat protein